MKNWKRILAILLAVLMVALTGCSSNEDPTTTAADTEATQTEAPQTTQTEAPSTTQSTVPVTESTEPITEEDTTGEEPTETEPEPETKEAYKIEKMEDCLDWMGMLAYDAGIPDKYFQMDDVLWVTRLEGKLFGKDAEGIIELLEDEEGLRVDRILLTCESLSYEEGKQLLTQRYGKPIEEKTDSSGQTDQGIVTYCVFTVDAGEVWLSKGTAEDFVRVEVY